MRTMMRVNNFPGVLRSSVIKVRRTNIDPTNGSLKPEAAKQILLRRIYSDDRWFNLGEMLRDVSRIAPTKNMIGEHAYVRSSDTDLAGVLPKIVAERETGTSSIVETNLEQVILAHGLKLDQNIELESVEAAHLFEALTNEARANFLLALDQSAQEDFMLTFLDQPSKVGSEFFSALDDEALLAFYRALSSKGQYCVFEYLLSANKGQTFINNFSADERFDLYKECREQNRYRGNKISNFLEGCSHQQLLEIYSRAQDKDAFIAEGKYSCMSGSCVDWFNKFFIYQPELFVRDIAGKFLESGWESVEEYLLELPLNERRVFLALLAKADPDTFKREIEPELE